jgi:hypothetical protein
MNLKQQRDDFYATIVDHLDNFVRPNSLARSAFINNCDSDMIYRLVHDHKITAADFAEWVQHDRDYWDNDSNEFL